MKKKTPSGPLTESYINDHMAGVHTFDSWGRALFEQALSHARSRVGTKGAEVVDIEATIRVAPVFATASAARKTPWCASVTVTTGTPPNTSTTTITHHTAGSAK